MQPENKIQINPFIIIGIFFEIIFIIFTITTLKNLLTKEQVQTTVETNGNFLQDQNIPKNAINIIEQGIYQSIALNSTNSETIQKQDLDIRENSFIFNSLKTLNIQYVNFIVDIPSKEQSYKVFYEWSDDKNNQYIYPNNSLFIMCPSSEEVFYDNFNCIDRYNGHAPNIIMYYEFKKFKNSIPEYNDVLISYTSEPWKDDFSFVIKPVKCDGQCEILKDTESKEKSLQAFKDFINKFGFSLNDLNYKIIE